MRRAVISLLSLVQGTGHGRGLSRTGRVLVAAAAVVLAQLGGAAQPETRTLRIAPPGLPEGVTEAVVRLWIVDSGGAPDRVLPDTVATRVDTGVFEAPVACTPSAVVSLMAPGFLCRPVLIGDGGCGSGRTVSPTLYRSRKLVLPVELDPGMERPGFFTVEARRCRGEAQHDATVLGRWVHPFPSPPDTTQGRIDLDVPVPAAACLDLTLYAPGAVPVSWSRVSTPDGTAQPPRLERRLLRPGLSVLSVLSSEDGLPCPDCRVVVGPADRLSQLVAAAFSGRLPASLPHGRTNADGWVRVSGFEGQGPWVVVAAGPGLAPAFATLTDVTPGHEPVAELTLGRWASLEVRVAGLESLDRPVTVTATPEVLCQRVPAAARTASLGDGVAQFPRLAPGTWELTAAIEVRQGLPEVIGRAKVKLQGGEHAVTELELEGSVYRGRVRLSGAPVAAELGFHPEGPSPQPPVYRGRSGDDGRFTVFLPKPGAYSVTVLSRREGIGATVPGVEVRSPQRPVAVDLPDGTISGVVVYADGSPAPEADVLAQRVLEDHGFARMITVETRSGPDGGFTLKGVGEGTWRVTGTKDRAASAEARARMTDGDTVSGLRLVLEEGTVIHGRVLTPQGSGVSAVVEAVFSTGGGAEAVRSVSVRTGADGTFELSLPSRALGRPASIAVFPANGWVSARRLVLQEDLVVMTAEGGGEVVLLLPEEWFRRIDPRGLLLVSSDGGLLPIVDLVARGAAASSADGRELRIPHLGADAWRLVRATPGGGDAFLAAPGMLPSLSEFSLAPGQQVDVEVDMP